jgi:hypothetical protein
LLQEKLCVLETSFHRWIHRQANTIYVVCCAIEIMIDHKIIPSSLMMHLFEPVLCEVDGGKGTRNSQITGTFNWNLFSAINEALSSGVECWYDNSQLYHKAIVHLYYY